MREDTKAVQSAGTAQGRDASHAGTPERGKSVSGPGTPERGKSVSGPGAPERGKSVSGPGAPVQAKPVSLSGGSVHAKPVGHAKPVPGTADGEKSRYKKISEEAVKPADSITGRRKKKAAPPEEAIVLDHVVKTYQMGAPALNGISLKVKRGEFVFIVGDSGSGKSTLIKLLLRELLPTEGSITVNGTNVVRLRRRKIPKFRRGIGVVFQDFRLLKDRNVYDNVAFAQLVIQAKARDIRRNVPMMLSLVGLAGKYKAKPKQLSGGEQQRVALARALVNNPPILLADEPTGNLDPKNSWEIMKLLEEINEKGTTVLVVTHNREIVNAMKKRVITMKKGVIVSDEEQGAYIDED